MNRKEKILEFIEKIEKEEGFIPQFCHNLKNDDKVYYGGPFYDKDEIVEAIDALLFGKWFSSGQKVKEFEKEMSKLLNQRSSLMVNSGSSANLVAIASTKKYYGWKDNDEVILSVVGFPTTLNPIIQNNLKPVFIDIEYDTLNFNLESIEEKITDKTKAIFVSPVLGNLPDLDRLLEISDKYDILLLLDCCDSLGTKWRDRHIAEYFTFSTLSFYPAHHITTGEGGMVCSNNEDIVRSARSFAWWGRNCYCVGTENLLSKGCCGKRFSKWIEGLDVEIDHKYLFTEIGYNLKPLDLQGAIGLAQLKKFDYIHKKRRENKTKIQSIFENIKGLKFCDEIAGCEASWFGVPIMCESSQLKHKLVSFLESKGVQTRNYFAGNILYHPAYKNLDDKFKYPNANIVLDRVFFLGCSPTINDEKIEYIQDVIENMRFV
jgi:CDP-6-deoxy-D-xylo-4-hexulose-3-dehydrase